MSRLTDLITRHEGRKPKMYKDSKGLWTIGIGRLLSGKRLSDDEIDLMFRNDLRMAHSIAVYFADGRWPVLGVVRRAVLTGMAFNLGQRLYRFKNLRKAIKHQDYEQRVCPSVEQVAQQRQGQMPQRRARQVVQQYARRQEVEHEEVRAEDHR